MVGRKNCETGVKSQLRRGLRTPTRTKAATHAHSLYYNIIQKENEAHGEGGGRKAPVKNGPGVKSISLSDAPRLSSRWTHFLLILSTTTVLPTFSLLIRATARAFGTKCESLNPEWRSLDASSPFSSSLSHDAVSGESDSKK